jgi:hypothetical protein
MNEGGTAMKSRKVLLSALFSMVIVFSLILLASVVGASGSIPRPDDCSIIHSAVDSSSLAYTIALNTHQEKVTPMVAAGYHHMVGLEFDGTLVAAGLEVDLARRNVGVEAANVGIKAGDWIKYELEITDWPAPYPEWLKLEFLSVEGTNATVRVTFHKSDGTEESNTVPVDIVAGSGEAFGFSGFVIPANLATGDSIYMTGYGNLAIESETTRTYAGARRTVIYASFSQYIYQFTYYWDKLTGVMVEESITWGDMAATAKAIETNMWEAAPRIEWWLWVIVAAAIVALALVVYHLKKRKKPTAPVSPTEGT